MKTEFKLSLFTSSVKLRNHFDKIEVEMLAKNMVTRILFKMKQVTLFPYQSALS